MGFNRPISREEELEQARRDYHDHNLTALPTIHKILFSTIEAIEEKQIPYALIGGLAVKELGRPRITHDIDVFVKPDDAERVLEVLREKGYTTEYRDPFWIYKAWRDEILVDVIFKSSGDIYFDEDIRSHIRRIAYHGHHLNTISPEDFIVIKAAAHQENNPHHWHDALAVLKQCNIDWEYLFKRAKNSPRRVLALLIYGQSNDIAIPSEIIQRLYNSLYGPISYVPEPINHPYRKDIQMMQTNHHSFKDVPIYIKGKIMEALTTDERIAEHDIKVIVSDNGVVAKGEVFTSDQKNAVEEVIKKIAPSLELENHVSLRTLAPPEGSEAIR